MLGTGCAGGAGVDAGRETAGSDRSARGVGAAPGRSRRHRRGALVLALALAGSVALGACGLGDDNPGGPPRAEASASAAPTSAGAAQADGEPVAADASLVTGITTVGSTDEVRRILTARPVVPGSAPMTARLAELTKARINASAAATRPAGGDPDAVPSVSTVWGVVGVSPDALGVRLITHENTGSAALQRDDVVWLVGGRVLAPADLFAAGSGLPDLLQSLGDALRRLGPPLAEPEKIESALTPETLTAVAFDPQGRLVVRFDPGLFGVPGAGQAVVVVDRQRTDDLLSDAGRAAQASAVTPRVRPAPAVAPTPSTSAAARPTTTPRTGRNAGPAPTRPAAVNCRVQSCIALTFDDGPSATTPTLLDRLAAAGAPATFFVLGPNAEARPDLLRRMVAEGHELGNHTWTHRVLTALRPDDVRADVVRTNLEITGAGGTPSLLRPPFGVTDARVNEVADGFGMQVARWNVDPQDWKVTDPAVITQEVLGAARRGAIVLLHDTAPATVDAVPAIVAGLRAKGLVPVTLSKMYAESTGGLGGGAAR